VASNKVRWVGSVDGACEPLVWLGNFQAGATQAIKRGELLELTGATNTAWVPLDSDFAMDSNVCIANEEVKSGDRAGYYEVIVPRRGDIFEYDIDTANNPTIGTAVYYSSSEAVSESGTNVLGYTVGQEHYPLKQGHLADDGSLDAGTTLKNVSQVRIVIREAVSYYSAVVQ